MTEPHDGDISVAEQLADEITSARRRGLADLDLETARQRRLDLPILSDLAQRHGAGSGQGSRVALIRRLLDDGLTAWGVDQPDEAAFVRELFFRSGSNLDTRVNPQTQLDKVRRERQLSEDQFDVRRRAAFRVFAEFLLRFVPEDMAMGEPVATTMEAPDELQPRQPAQLRRRGSAPIVIGVLATLAIIGVVIGLVASNAGSGKSKTPGQASITAGRSGSPTGPIIKFDDLGGGSSTIAVYPGVQPTTRDRTASGTFKSGDTVMAICKTDGRTIHSDPSSGEKPRSSSTWVRIQGSTGKVQFATLTYADIDARDLAALPTCVSVP